MLKHRYHYLNGKIIEAKQMVLPINDLAILRGYGVFDFMRTYQGHIFHFNEHFKRFVNSAKQVGLKVELSAKQTEKICYQLIKKNKLKDASIRLILTGGPTTDGFTVTKPTLVILIESIYTLPAEYYQTGAQIITHEFARTFPQAKTTNYLTALTLAPLKVKRGAIEILYVDNGRVLEATTSNIFVVKADKVFTPKTDVLPGITAQVVKKLLKQVKFKLTEEKNLSVKLLNSADEVFLTATNKEVLPIVNIDGRKVGDGKIGPITKQLMELFLADTKKPY